MFLETRNGKIAFETHGEEKERAIVFIHGFPFDRSMWNDQARLLSKDHFVVLFDIRGHGESDQGSGQYLLEFFVDDLIALLDHLRLATVCLCGLSMGGYTALRAIEREPSRFSGLVLCDTKSTADTNAAKLNRANQIKMILAGKKVEFAEGQLKSLFAPENFKRTGEAVERIKKTILSTRDVVLVGALIALAARMDMTESLSKVSVPTLVIVGADDKITPPSEAELMYSKIRGSKLAVIRGAGHISNLENAPEFNSTLQGFLAENNL